MKILTAYLGCRTTVNRGSRRLCAKEVSLSCLYLRHGTK